MRILLLNQFFWPDSAATSQFVTDLARHLADERHSVTAICGSSGYAVSDGSTPPAVQIERLPILRFGPSTVMRSLSYATFLLTATWRAARAKPADVVITLTTPPLLSLIGTLIKKLRG